MRGLGLRTRAALVALEAATCCALGATAASASTQTLGLGGWQVQSSAVAPQGGAAISDPSFDASSWLAVHPDDAGAVGTEVNALLQNGECPDVFFSTNMKQCFGYMDSVGPDTIARFSVPWWFRTTFTAPPAGQHAWLIVNGVVGHADLWVNGTLVASQARIQGAFAQYTFDVTSLLRSGRNALALEVVPNDPTKMLTLDDVDWNQIPPDNNTGIQFPIQLHTAQALGIDDVHVVQHD